MRNDSSIKCYYCQISIVIYPVVSTYTFISASAVELECVQPVGGTKSLGSLLPCSRFMNDVVKVTDKPVPVNQHVCMSSHSIYILAIFLQYPGIQCGVGH